MLDITPVLNASAQLIDRYGTEGFTIAGSPYPGSVLLLPEACRNWDVSALEAVTMESVSWLLDSPELEILLVGSGAQHLPTPISLRQACLQRGVGLEVMSTGAACRTYNVLLAEGRRVGAALIAL